MPERDARGRFLPGGPSPNPTGRAPLPAGIKERAARYSPELLTILNEIAHDPKQPGATRCLAANSILDRYLGKPQMHVSTEDITDPKRWTNDQLDAAIASLGASMEESEEGQRVKFSDGTHALFPRGMKQ